MKAHFEVLFQRLPYASPQMNQGADGYALRFDRASRVLYSANTLSGFWRVQLAPLPDLIFTDGFE